MEGCDGGGSHFGDDDLRKLRAQEADLRATQDAKRVNRERENEKIDLRKRIRKLGAKPCA